MALVAAPRTLEDECVLAEFIAKFIDFGIAGYRQFLTGRPKASIQYPAGASTV
jgi:hypothetical protein